MPTEDYDQAQYLSSQVEQARQRAVLAASDSGAARDDARTAEHQAREHAKKAGLVVVNVDQAVQEAKDAADRAEAPTDSMVAELAGNPVSLTRAAVDQATGDMITTNGSTTQTAGDARWLKRDGADIAVASEIERTGSEIQVSGDARWVTNEGVDSKTANLIAQPDTSTNAALSTAIDDKIAAIDVGGGVDRVVTATIPSGTYTVDLTVGDMFILTLAGNAALAVTGLAVGRSFLVEVHQDATGGRNLTLPPAAGNVSLATTASTWETLVYYSTDGTTLRVAQMGAGGGGGPVTPPAFSVASLADKIAWFQGSTLGADGTPITSWADSFAHAGDAVQADPARQPVVKVVNGVKVAAFTSDHLQTPVFAAWAQPITVAALVKFTSTAGVQAHFYGAAGQFGGYHAGGNVGIYNGASVSSGVPMSTTAYQVVVGIFDGAASKIRVDGTQATGGAGSVTLTQLNLGSNATPASFFQGEMAEMIVVGHAATGTELADIEAYLNAKKADLAS